MAPGAPGFTYVVAANYPVAKDTTSEATFVGAGDSNQLGPDAKLAKGYSRFHTPHRFTLNSRLTVRSASSVILT